MSGGPREARNCEYPEAPGPEGCREKAAWVVGVGTREADRQLSCGRHLNRTCQAMTEAEYPRTATLTVTRVTAS